MQMKETLSDEIRLIIKHIKAWLKHEIRYVKLTAAEKLTIFVGSVFLMAMISILVMIALVIISMCLVSVFEVLVGQVLAYLCVAVIFLLLAGVLYLLRKPLIFDPMARMISKLILDNEENK